MKRIYITFLIAFLIPFYSFAMEHENEEEHDRKVVKTRTTEERNFYYLDYFLNHLDWCFTTLANLWQKQDYFQNMPNEVIVYLSSFLKSEDILRFSGTNKRLRAIFDERFWLSYIKKGPESYSYLLVRGSLSPLTNRKMFFAHLWYVEDKINKSAKLGHPEALIIHNYKKYGVYITRDEYVCPLNQIKHKLDGKVNQEKTEKLFHAINKKIDEDLQKTLSIKQRNNIYRNRGRGNY